MFRIRILSAWVIMTMLFSACADWVNVSPKDEIEADKLFKSENGSGVLKHGKSCAPISSPPKTVSRLP